jgi:hypothetical protein
LNRPTWRTVVPSIQNPHHSRHTKPPITSTGPWMRVSGKFSKVGTSYAIPSVRTAPVEAYLIQSLTLGWATGVTRTSRSDTVICFLPTNGSSWGNSLRIARRKTVVLNPSDGVFVNSPLSATQLLLPVVPDAFTEQTLRVNGFLAEAEEISAIRKRKAWSAYVVDLLHNLQRAMRKYMTTRKLRFLLYPEALTDRDRRAIQKKDSGVVWL